MATLPFLPPYICLYISVHIRVFLCATPNRDIDGRHISLWCEWKGVVLVFTTRGGASGCMCRGLTLECMHAEGVSREHTWSGSGDNILGDKKSAPRRTCKGSEENVTLRCTEQNINPVVSALPRSALIILVSSLCLEHFPGPKIFEGKISLKLEFSFKYESHLNPFMSGDLLHESRLDLPYFLEITSE